MFLKNKFNILTLQILNMIFVISCNVSDNQKTKNKDLSENNILIRSRRDFIFCSLVNNNGCTGMAVGKSNDFPTNKPYFFATSHTEEGLHTIEQLLFATNFTNKICTFSYLDFGLNPCNFGSFGKNPYFIYDRNWSSGDLIAGESDGSVVPYLKFHNGNIIEVKIYLAPHGSSEFTPTFYEPKNKEQQYYKICIKDWLQAIPKKGRLIQGFMIANNYKYHFKSKEHLLDSLNQYGFTTSENDENSSLIIPTEKEFCP